MKQRKIGVIIGAVLLLLSSGTAVLANDFNWMDDFNVRAGINLDDFKTRLSTRFRVGMAEVEAVIRDIRKPADAYMIFRLGEMCSQPRHRIMEHYRSHRGQGWGVVAKNLGIKPGSDEFRSLKQRHDLDFNDNTSQKGEKKKGKHKKKDMGMKGKSKKK